jgi:electron transfer flavoprotein beta subunit
MKIAVVMRQVPDPIEPLEIAESGASLDEDQTAYIPNETDEHALEQALLLKEATGGSVTVIAFDGEQTDAMLHAAAAKGAGQLIKLPLEVPGPAGARAGVAALAAIVRDVAPDLLLIGCLATNELEGSSAPLLAHALGWPYVGGVRGVEPAEGGVRALKEFPAAVRAEMAVALPAVLGVLAASEPIRYVPVAKIRAAMKSARVEEHDALSEAAAPLASVVRLRAPESGRRARMLDGAADEVARLIVGILAEKGLVR